jgi:hypothetical protein
MNRFDYRRLALATLMMGALGTTAALAEEGTGPGGHKGPGMFKEADTDGDGFLTRMEMDAVHQKRLDKMFAETDTNKDSKLSEEEMKAGREKMREKFKGGREKFKGRMKQGTTDPIPSADMPQ